MNLIERLRGQHEDLVEWWQNGIPRLLAGFCWCTYLLVSLPLWSRAGLFDLPATLEQYTSDYAQPVVIGTATTVSLIHGGNVTG